MAGETPRDADAETTYIALTKRLEAQYIENLAFVEARGGIGENGATVRDAFLDAADAVARLSPDERAARVAVARARAAAPAVAPAPAPAAFGVPAVPGRFGGLGTAFAPRAPAPVGGQRPFAPRAPPFVPQIRCEQPGVTVSVSLWLPDVASVDINVLGDARRMATVALHMKDAAVRRFGLKLGGAVGRSYGLSSRDSSLVMLTFVKLYRDDVWPEPLAVVIPDDGTTPRTANELIAAAMAEGAAISRAEAMAPAPAPAPAAPPPPAAAPPAPAALVPASYVPPCRSRTRRRPRELSRGGGRTLARRARGTGAGSGGTQLVRARQAARGADP